MHYTFALDGCRPRQQLGLLIKNENNTCSTRYTIPIYSTNDLRENKERWQEKYKLTTRQFYKGKVAIFRPF